MTRSPHSGLAFAMLASKKLASHGVITLAIEESSEPPAKFRIFKAGWNVTQIGKFLFDAKAAKAVMAAYAKWGIDLAIDLEHQMFADEPSPDPTAKDARGWCKLELREDGSLWAVAVKWTEDGAARLTEKRQRYISPAFKFDMKTRRVNEIVNIALVAMPATNGAQELMAASVNAAVDFRKLAVGPSFEDIRTALCAQLDEKYPSTDLSSPRPWIVAVYDATVVYQYDGKYFEAAYARDGESATLSGEGTEVVQTFAPASTTPAAPAPAPAPAPPPETPPAAPADENAAAAKRTVMKFPKALVLAMLAALSANDQEAGLSCLSQATALAGATSTLPKELSTQALEAVANGDAKASLELLKQILAALMGGDVAPAPDAGGEEAAAAARVAMATTGKPTIGEAMAELARRSTIAVGVEEREVALARDRSTLELDERTTIVRSLQTLGVETPATSGLANGKLCERLLKEPITELRTRHAMLLGAKGGKPALALQPPRSEVGDGRELTVKGRTVQLSARELEKCKERGVDPEKYASTKLQIVPQPSTGG